MIRHYFDTEFNGYGGKLMSAAMVRDEQDALYLIDDAAIQTLLMNGEMDPWVRENVVPILYSPPAGIEPVHAPSSEWGALISEFIYREDEVPQVFADWMTDIADLMNLFVTGPGTGVPMAHQTHMVCLRHLDVYPTTLPGAVQHNAAWDALALKRWLDEMEAK
jgi:hypothetical protein